MPFLLSTKECSKVEIVLFLVPALSYQAYLAVFLTTLPRQGFFFANSDHDHECLLKFPFLFPKQSRCYLPDSYGDPQPNQSTLVMVRRKLEWKLDFRALARSSAEGTSIVVAIGTSRVRWLWSIVQKRKKKEKKRSQRVIVRRLYPSSSTNQRVLRSLFPRCRYRFAFRSFRGRGCTAAGRSGCSAVKAKKSSHPWHFRCWSLRRNELECTFWFTGRGIAPFFVMWCYYCCWFCVGKALWRWFYLRSRKRDHFQTLATGVRKLKTWLGTQWVREHTRPGAYAADCHKAGRRR